VSIGIASTALIRWKRAARTDARTVSGLIDVILTEWCEQRGYLDLPREKRRK
jgi:hypothetical protein